MRHKGPIAIMLAVGVVLIFAGFYAFENTMCNCPGQIVGQINKCVCLPSPEAYFSFFLGIILVLGGIGSFFQTFRQK